MSIWERIQGLIDQFSGGENPLDAITGAQEGESPIDVITQVLGGENNEK